MSFGSNSLLRGMGSLELDSNKIIVGVDYGTTFTGVSYVSSKGTDLSDIKLVRTWPGPSRDTETVFKTPSRIAYASDNPRISKDRWGYQVEAGMIAYSWTKLLLDQGAPITEYDDSALETASKTGILKLPDGKKAVIVVADYLSEVYKHIMNTLAKHITEEALNITPIDFWFTVPAIWSDQAKDATMAAAKLAGFGNSIFTRPNDKIFLISEPEAAAITALKKYTTSGMGGSVKVGDGVLVCDCGGGTVDITTYLVNQVFPTLKFEELCTGTGGKCGSTAVDRNFYALMSRRFGDAFDSLPMKRKSPGSEFMRKFEIIKRDFGHSDEETTFELPLNMTVSDPDPEYFDEEERLVFISSEDLRTMFDPVVEQILSLVRQQIIDARRDAGKRVINRIILVGGFGDSEYLRESFRAAFGSNGRIAITVPDSPQVAIVQGAALRGLEGLQSTTRRCRRHYGFSLNKPFRYGVDDEANSYIHPFDGKKMTSGRMEWLIAKGQKYSHGYTNSIDLSYFHDEWAPPKYSVKFYACQQKHAPERVDDFGVSEIGEIVVDFTNTDLAKFYSKIVNGWKMYKLDYELQVVFGAQEGVLKFTATSRGQTIGRASINFDAVRY
ncbi:hypothetical protein BDW62DRAFT_199691 [Aspergillus aurantiobrunneus]